MKRHILYLLSLTVTLLLSISCTSEDVIQGESKRGHTLTFTLASSSPKPQQTRATTKVEGESARNENRVDRVDIFFYDGQNCLFYPSAQQTVIDGDRVTITVPETEANILFGRTCTVYVLANCALDRSAMVDKTLSELKALVMTNSIDFNIDPQQIQPNFLMDGQLSVAIAPSVNNLGLISLKRAAAKVIVEIAEAGIDGYTPGVAAVTFSNYLNTTTLGDGTFYTPQSADMKRSGYREIGDLSVDGSHLAEPFYSYPNNWEYTAEQESYLILRIPWTSQATGVTKLYYYRIPFSYIEATGEVDANKFQLRRNYIYQFLVNVSVLGGLDPEAAVELDCNFEVKDWTTKEIEVSMLAYDFLVVFKRDAELHNKESLSINYASSTPIEITDISASCLEYAVSGTITQKYYSPGNTEYPIISVNSALNSINIQTTVPINYVPKTITFNVRNSSLLTQSVRLVVYPPKYITAQQAPTYPSGDPREAGSTFGSNNPNGATGQTNFNMFTITTKVLSVSDLMPAGSPFNSMPITIGDPTFDDGTGYIQTKLDLYSNSIMSPQFVVASQRGISSQYIYEDAVLRCKGYQEGPYGRGTWRIPTSAELAYGNMLQNDPNSAVKGLFVAGDNSWWTAYKPYGFNFQSNVLVNASSHYIRCVHDTWKD